MYHAYFKLGEEPFGVSPDCRFFYQPPQHREAVAALCYAIEQRRGFALLVGRAGLGKSTVLARVMQLLEGKAEIAYLAQPYFDHTTVLESILVSLGIEPTTSPARNHRLFYEYLREARRAGKTCAVVFDEAQDLKRETLEAIRVLSNFETPRVLSDFETPAETLLQIVLAGQPALADTLSQPDCDQIRQRLNVVARLTPLSQREVYDYIAYRMEVAGASAPLFNQDALEAIAIASGGVPRNVNNICFNSLTLAYASNKPQVGREEVEEVRHDLDLALDGALPLRIRIPESVPAFVQVGRSFRTTWITCGVAPVLLAAGTLLFRTLPARDLKMVVPATSSLLHSTPIRTPEVVPTSALAVEVGTSDDQTNAILSAGYIDKAMPSVSNVHSTTLRTPEGVQSAGFAVQVGAFGNRANAERVCDEMTSSYGVARIVEGPQDPRLWLVLVGAESTEDGANALALRIRKESSRKNTIVVRDAPAVHAKQSASENLAQR